MFQSFSVNSLFEKKFTFQPDRFPKLESIDGHYFSSPLWEFFEGSQLRVDLDEIRSRLDDKDLISWGKHTTRTDLASFVMSDIRRKIPNIQYQLFTRAWCKLMEILITFPVIKLRKKKIKDKGIIGLYLCEAPGSFVHATNYYVKSEKPDTRFKWTATTLNPYYEQIDIIKTLIGDDRFIQCKGIYGNWFFGEDDLGDLMNVNTVKQIFHKFSKIKADLITGDGGISCIDEPDKQEQLSFPLIFHQFITAINCLKPGGSLILKMFNLFSSQSLCLIYLINNLFNQVNCFKPVLSKSGNSEVYLVCIELLEGNSKLINSITSQYFGKLEKNGDILSTSSLLDQTVIPQEFVEQFINCSRQFKDYQKATIVENLDIFADPNRETIYFSLNQIKKTVSRIYTTKRYPLKYTDDQINFGYDYSRVRLNCFNYYHYSLSNIISSNESYEKRKSQMGIIPMEKISNVLVNLYQRDEIESLIREWKTIIDSDNLPTSNAKIGKPFTKITNSRFVDKNLLHLYNLVTSANGQNTKIHEINCQQSLTFSAQRTEARIGHMIKSCLEQVDTKFNYLIAPESSLIVGPILKTLNDNQINPNLLSMGENFNFDSLDNRGIIIIDPFNYDGLNSSGNCLSIIEQEQNLIGSIVDQLIDYLVVAKSTDLLVIHSCSLLSRLMVELIFILTKLFQQILIVPSFTNHLVEDNKNYQLGILIVFTNLGQLIEFTDDRNKEIISILEKIKILYSESRKLDKTLLEIFPIIEILTNISFCQLIYTGNFVQLAEKMETHLQISNN